MPKEVKEKKLELMDTYSSWENKQNVSHRQHIGLLKNKLARGAGVRKNLGDGLWELKNNKGAGWRLYYAEEGDTYIILVFGGGDKDDQRRDIKKAKQYLEEYQTSRK